VYCGPSLLVRLRALRLFQQAARKVVLRCRVDRRLACLRKMAAGVKESSHRSRQEQVKDGKKADGLMISPDKILPFSFPVGVDADDQLVPQHFKVMGYRPPSSWEAFNSYVPPSSTRPLRSAALDELLPEVTGVPVPGSEGPPRARQGQEEEEEVEEVEEVEVEVEDAHGTVALLQPVPANPIRIFNPVPGLRVSLDLRTDMLPVRAPPPLAGPSDGMVAALVDRLPEGPAVCLTPDMIRAEFLGEDDDVDDDDNVPRVATATTRDRHREVMKPMPGR
ncbi:hypothetical protein CRUP_026907, partial [Coryphaenoides rupestris]